MYRIAVTDHFDAAHQLRDYEGRCRNIHGHRFEVTVELEGESLDERGILVDFIDVRRLLAQVLDAMDHGFLNQKPPFDELNPTSENIARHVFDSMGRAAAGTRARVRAVTVAESPTARVTYEPPPDGAGY